MNANRPFVSLLALLLVLPACDGKTEEQRQAEAMLRALHQMGAAKADLDPVELARLIAGDAPVAAERAPVEVDVSTLVTEEEIAAILRQLRAGGDGTDTATFRSEGAAADLPGVSGEPGFAAHAWKIQWTAKWPDRELGAQGSFCLAVGDRRAFEEQRIGKTRAIHGLGDEAFASAGVPWMRVGELAATVCNNTGTGDLAELVLRAAAPRLRAAQATGSR